VNAVHSIVVHDQCCYERSHGGQGQAQPQAMEHRLPTVIQGGRRVAQALPTTRPHTTMDLGSLARLRRKPPDLGRHARRAALPKDALRDALWALNLPRNSNGNSDGLTATLPAGGEAGMGARFEHSIIVFDRQATRGRVPHLDKLFSQLPAVGAAPDQDQPYDKEKHV